MGGEPKKTYDHAFDVAFSVHSSEHEKWEDCLEKEKEKVMDAIRERIDDLFKDGEYLEAITGFDTYEEEPKGAE